jgi:hypothetical protein
VEIMDCVVVEPWKVDLGLFGHFKNLGLIIKS